LRVGCKGFKVRSLFFNIYNSGGEEYGKKKK